MKLFLWAVLSSFIGLGCTEGASEEGDTSSNDGTTDADTDTQENTDSETDSNSGMDTDTQTSADCKATRDYPAAGTKRLFGMDAPFEGTFDVTALTYASVVLGDYNGDEMRVTQSFIYPGIEAFVDERAPMGSVRHTSSAVSIINLSTGVELTGIHDTYTFDGDRISGRSSESSENGQKFKAETVTYNAWDDSGRPLSGALEHDESGHHCTNVPVTIAYDDTARTVTETIDYLSEDVIVITGSPNCNRTEVDVNQNTYDGDNFISRISDDGGETSQIETVEVTETGVACY